MTNAVMFQLTADAPEGHVDALPSKAYEDDAGFDLPSAVEVTLQPGERKAIKTGYCVAIPKGYYGRVAPRSGLGVKKGIDVLAGVVDCGYRDEVLVALINHGNEPVTFQIGDRIAQLVVTPVFTGKSGLVDSLEIAERGVNGFGSTGA